MKKKSIKKMQTGGVTTANPVKKKKTGKLVPWSTQGPSSLTPNKELMLPKKKNGGMTKKKKY